MDEEPLPSDCFPEKLSNKFRFLNPDVSHGGCLILYNARKTSYRIIEHSWFETFIVSMIMASSVALAFEDVNLRDKPQLQRALKYSDKIFTYVFICEMVLKWMGYGFKKYFTNAWCWLDFCIVSVSTRIFYRFFLIRVWWKFHDFNKFLREISGLVGFANCWTDG